MRVLGEKMRQIGFRLKSGGERLRQAAGARVAEAATSLREFGGRLDDLRKRRLHWTGSPAASAELAADGARGAAGQPYDDRAPRGEWARRRPRLVKALRIAALVVAAYLILPYPLILAYRFIDPPFSALMMRHALLGRDIDRTWADFEDISPNLATAAVIAEDASLCRHWGVDWNAVGQVLEDLEEGDAPRGASTIPMQTAKNLFLWPEQTYIRKALEVPLAYFMTLAWPKQRVVEVYLNIAEWGPGIYGAEAASQYHFGKSASRLSRSEAALLVAALPSPLKRNAGRPGPRMQRLASRIEARVAREGQDAACIFSR